VPNILPNHNSQKIGYQIEDVSLDRLMSLKIVATFYSLPSSTLITYGNPKDFTSFLTLTSEKG